MEKFIEICAAVLYEARNKFVWNRNKLLDEIEKPEIKKAMRLTVQKMLHKEIYGK